VRVVDNLSTGKRENLAEVAELQEPTDDVGADEAGAAGDETLHRGIHAGSGEWGGRSWMTCPRR
jgi:hypothetical protein